VSLLPWRALSLRARLTLVATAALAAALTAGAALLIAVTHRSGVSAVDESALRTAREVAALYRVDHLPAPIPVTNTATGYVQIVAPTGEVIATSANADRLKSLLRPDQIRAVRSGARLDLPGDLAGIDSRLRVVGVEADTADGPATVVVAAGTEQLADSERVIRQWVYATGPALLLALALLIWLLVGLTLRPVAELRRSAADISGRDLDERLPVAAARDEISRLATTLNDMLDRIDASRRRQRSFVSDAAHELRSPIAGIRTQLEVAQRTGEWDLAATEALTEVQRLSQLVDDLLLLAKLDERRPPRPGVVDLGSLAADLLTSRYTSARVPVTVSAPPEPVVVSGDPDALRRLLANLLDNATRHASSRVAVSVLSAPPGFRVDDDGPGIPAADRERMFDRFARRDDARARDAGGSGLGLPIARELARVHNGTLTLGDAAPGLSAELRLPVGA
jgi:signal transduction histidine kinase